MKRVTIVAMFFIYGMQALAYERNQAVNVILGDISFVKRFHTKPDAHTSEQLRIVTHLEYVEVLLRQKNVSALALPQQRNRATVIKLLQAYIARGRFPVNEKYAGERRSCFIDRNGNICAVGYLIEKTLSRFVAEHINRKYQYDYIKDMNDPVIATWADDFGLTLEECAMIQPTYGPFPDPNREDIQHPIKTSQGVASSVIGGVNAGLLFANLSGATRGAGSTLARVGLFTGAAQIIYGMATVKNDRIHSFISGPSYRESYKAQNILSYVNIATGAATVMTSVVNMAMNRKGKCRKNAVNLYSSPGINNNLNVGFAFVKRLE